MATAALNRGQIIEEGLRLGGSPGLTTRARVFLNLFLDKYWRAKDWADLELEDTSLATVADTETISLAGITTLRKISKVWQSGDAEPLHQTEKHRIYAQLNVMREDSNSGRPTHFYHDRANNQLVLYPIPDDARSLRVLYYDLPAQPDTSVPATYDADTPSFPDAQTLVQAVAFFAQRWNQDSLLAISNQALAQALDDHAAEEADMDQGSNQLGIELDPTIYKTWLPE